MPQSFLHYASSPHSWMRRLEHTGIDDDDDDDNDDDDDDDEEE